MSEASSRRLRQLLSADGPLVVPGVGSALEAQLVREAGFAAVYVSGYATAAWVHGVPDVGVIGLKELSASTERVRAVTELPLIVDADTGYGDATSVAVTVRRLERAGAAAVQLEDQAWPKRCGHLGGKRVVPADTMARRLHAALAARRRDTLVIARTDAREPLGLEEAVRRARRYHALGADVTFVDAPESRDELALIGRELPGCKLVNMSETGRTPLLPAGELHALGFDVVLFPTSGVRLAAKALRSLFAELRATGDSSAFLPRMLALDELNATLGLEPHDNAAAFS